MALKYRVDIRQGLTNYLMAREGSLSLVGNLSNDGVTIEILVDSNLKMHLIIFL